ncbi:MAG: T9SS type A sorting domain-containing protein [Ignavibacteriaceae bacterium]
MFKPVNIILCFLLFFVTLNVKAQDNFKVFVPEYIPKDTGFEVSIVTSKNISEAEKLNIYFFPEFSLGINSVELRTEKGEYQIPIINEYSDKFSEISRKISLDVSDTSVFYSESFFEIVIRLNPQNVTSNFLEFYSEYIGGDEVLGHLKITDENLATDQPDLYKLSFNYFEKFYTAELAARFEQNSFLNIPLEYNFDENLVAEFWIKFKNYKSTFLEIVNWETNKVEYYLSVNENQLLAINSKLNRVFQSQPLFISSNCWYHFVVIFNKANSHLSFLCNDEELASISTNNYINFNNLLFHFKNINSTGVFNLDQFRIVSDNGSMAGVIKNKNYASYSDDSSVVALQINFSEKEIEKFLEDKIISYNGLKLVKSNAPIFPRAPQIDIKFLNNFFEVDWTGGDFRNADYYSLERAIGTNGFVEVNRVEADNNEEKNYSLLTEKPNQTEILYFRIKQVSKDGSSVYSDIVKLGQGEIEDVILGQNYPNPFNPTTTIRFELLQDSDVEVKVFNLEGKEVAMLYKGFLNRGNHQFEFEAKDLSSGIYIYQIITPLSIKSHKMILAK